MTPRGGREILGVRKGEFLNKAPFYYEDWEQLQQICQDHAGLALWNTQMPDSATDWGEANQEGAHQLGFIEKIANSKKKAVKMLLETVKKDED